MLIYQIFTSGNFVSGLLMLLAVVIVGAFAIMLHEVAHGYAAYLNGDFTAKYAGRLTLNPLKHFDILGTIMMLIVGFGWAKPVPIDSRNFTNYRKGMLMTSLAGVTMNLILAVVALIGLCIVTAVFGAANVIVGYGGSMYYATASMAARYAYEFFYYLCAYGVTINMTLFLFNLIPIYPLDGFRVVETLAKPDNAYVRFNYRYGNFLLIGVILIFTVLGYIASYIGVNLNIFGQYQNLFIRLMSIIQNSILGGM